MEKVFVLKNGNESVYTCPLGLELLKTYANLAHYSRKINDNEILCTFRDELKRRYGMIVKREKEKGETIPSTLSSNMLNAMNNDANLVDVLVKFHNYHTLCYYDSNELSLLTHIIKCFDKGCFEAGLEAINLIKTQIYLYAHY